jgi:hypothetical protein
MFVMVAVNIALVASYCLTCLHVHLCSQAFWREKGFSGEVFSCGGCKAEHTCDAGPVSEAYDATTHDGQPAIAGYMASKTGIHWSSKNVRF